jgi:hypothetical protein
MADEQTPEQKAADAKAAETQSAEAKAAEAKAEEQKAADQKAADEARVKEWESKSKKDMLDALNAERDAKLAANAEAKARRIKIDEMQKKLEKYEEAEKLASEEDMRAVELLAKRDAEILDLKTKYSNLEGSIVRDRVVSKVTEALVGKGFAPKIVKMAISTAPNLSEDTAENFIKEFAAEWKDTLAPAPPAEKPKPANPWAQVQAKADDAPEGTPGRTPQEKQFNALFPAKPVAASK